MHSEVFDEMIPVGTYPVYWLANVKWSPDEMNRVVHSAWSMLLADSGRCGCFSRAISFLNQENKESTILFKFKKGKGENWHGYLTYGTLKTLGQCLHALQDAEAKHLLHIS